MRDISLKPTTLRTARAAGFVKLPAEALARVKEGSVQKGDVREAARLAGLMAVKRTPDLLPHCHPIGVLRAEVTATVVDDGIELVAEVETVSATGVEMEALTAVSVAALTVYDMLKAHAKADQMKIGNIRLVEKKGGKSSYSRVARGMSAAILVMSDTVAAKKKPDTAGASVRDRLAEAGFQIAAYEVLADEHEQIGARVRHFIAQKTDCILTVGGTGLGPRDVTVDVVEPLLTTPLPGFMEAARSFGQSRTPYAMLSRGVAGLAGSSFVATFPGSRRGAEETLAAVLPGLIHLLDVCRTLRPHEGGYS
ncbi:MAG: molybdenum cofactor biosynthesis protein MoaC [Panacagrimonas sp.]|jgi:molybdenum cofactor biosynthesis protein MoaC|nr:bifunctional molybdenum cofactor biosynthesis protein MoaC/MoaB [Panacagrimonas sp.]MCC2656767.1 molybdenum cofactor biosynthesis protein MoaC [Panacagrimonas sp.]